MDTSTHTNQPQPRRLAVKAAIVVLGLGLAAMLLFYPFLVGRAEAILERFDQPSKSGGAEALSGPDQTTATFTPTNTQVINSTWTSTATATATETATNPPPTSTETATPPPELTPTNTATKTGTQPTPTMTATPTVTGTLVPNPTLIVKVKPTEAYIGQKFTFDIVIGNSGTGPLTEVIISDHFPSYINVETVASQRGVVTRSPHSFGVSVGYVNPGETINITAVVKVTSNALVTETIPNVVTMTYYPSKSKTASVNYKVIASALPGTGGLPSVRQQAPPVNASALRQSLLAGLLGLILIVYALWSQRQGARTPRWMPLSGVLLLLLALGSGLAAAGIFGPAPPEQAAALPEASTAPLEGVQAAAGHPRAVDFVTPEAQPLMTLPVYEIPTPVVSATAEPGEQEPDTTAIKRIIIPYLLVDTVVAYIPFDGNTWLIFWDDSGANNDDDYDDLIARVYFEPGRQVPEPATLGLLAAGLMVWACLLGDASPAGEPAPGEDPACPVRGRRSGCARWCRRPTAAGRGSCRPRPGRPAAGPPRRARRRAR